MRVRHVALNVRRCAACVPTLSPATAHLPSNFAICARTFATGAPKSVAHTTWITASAARRLVAIAPQHAAK